MSFTGPLFVVGMPRSGTKLLRELLNRHPLVGIPGVETEFLPWLVSHFNSFGDLRDPARFDVFFSKITRATYFEFRRAEGAVFDARRWQGSCREFTPAGIFEALLRMEVEAPYGSDRIWGDKSPSYIDDLALIKRLYPGAKIVHIIRDARDYCLSINKAWGKNILRAAQRWAEGVEGARQAGSALGNDYIEVRYEDLLSHTEDQLRRVCVLIGIEFDSRMLSLAKPSENLGDTRGLTHVVNDNHGKFATAFSDAVLAEVEALTGCTLLAFGYTLVHPLRNPVRLSKFHMACAQLADGWQLVRRVQSGNSMWKTAMFHVRYFLATRG